MDDPQTQLEDLRVGELTASQSVALTCRSCGTRLVLGADEMQSLARPYQQLDRFGEAHVCGYCRKLGADIEVIASAKPHPK